MIALQIIIPFISPMYTDIVIKEKIVPEIFFSQWYQDNEQTTFVHSCNHSWLAVSLPSGAILLYHEFDHLAVCKQQQITKNSLMLFFSQ